MANPFRPGAIVEPIFRWKSGGDIKIRAVFEKYEDGNPSPGLTR